jgi:MoaA/NifB/PqqE/SkfB family radical SAM enzyme
VTALMEAPPQVRWNYTYLCNFSCTHCYTRAAWYPSELSTGAYESIAAQLIDAGVFVVGLGGGEALLRRDCLPMIARLNEGGIYTVLTTNGWRVDDRCAERLAGAGLGRLKVSLDSPSPEEHDAFRNRSNSYERVMRALRAGVRAGLSVYLSTVVTAGNVNRLRQFVEIAHDSGLNGVGFIPFRPAGKGVAVKSRHQLREDQQERIREELASLRRESGLDLVLSGDADGVSVERECGCGVAHVTVRPNGDVSPCNFAEDVVGNLTRDSLVELWRNSEALQAWRAHGGCRPSADQPAPSNPHAPWNGGKPRAARATAPTAVPRPIARAG